jgi:hypothetical protein
MDAVMNVSLLPSGNKFPLGMYRPSTTGVILSGGALPLRAGVEGPLSHRQLQLLRNRALPKLLSSRAERPQFFPPASSGAPNERSSCARWGGFAGGRTRSRGTCFLPLHNRSLASPMLLRRPQIFGGLFSRHIAAEKKPPGSCHRKYSPAARAARRADRT